MAAVGIGCGLGTPHRFEHTALFTKPPVAIHCPEQRKSWSIVYLANGQCEPECAALV